MHNLDNQARNVTSNPWEMKERWAKVREIAELYSMSEEAVRRKARDGTWPSHRQGKAIRFSPDDQQRIEDMWKSTRPDRIETREEKKARSARIQRLVSENTGRGLRS